MRVFHYDLLKYGNENAEMQKRKFDDITLCYSIDSLDYPLPAEAFTQDPKTNTLSLECRSFTRHFLVQFYGNCFLQWLLKSC